MYQKRIILCMIFLAIPCAAHKPKKTKTVELAKSTQLTGQKKESVEKKVTKKTDRTVTITNNIDHDMLGYRYLMKTHHPDEFVLSINGKEIKEKECHTLPIENDKVVIHFDYQWASGLYKGSKDVHFDVEPAVDKLTVTFDWKDKNGYQVLVDRAKPCAIKEAPKLKKTTAEKSDIS